MSYNEIDDALDIVRDDSDSITINPDVKVVEKTDVDRDYEQSLINI